jgi:hypothetical protein
VTNLCEAEQTIGRLRYVSVRFGGHLRDSTSPSQASAKLRSLARQTEGMAMSPSRWIAVPWNRSIVVFLALTAARRVGRETAKVESTRQLFLRGGESIPPVPGRLKVVVISRTSFYFGTLEYISKIYHEHDSGTYCEARLDGH